MVDRDQLLTEIARVTGVRLSTADPIIAAAVINDVLLDKTLAKLDVSLKAAADRQEAVAVKQAEASKQHIEDAKKAASALVNSSTEWVTGRLTEAGDKVTASILAELREETAKAESASRLAIKMAWAAGACAVFTAAGLAGFLVAAL